MKNVFLATAASFAFASAAFAGNPAPISPVMPVVVPAAANTGADWGGFYLGATYGTGVGGDMVYSTGGVVGSTYPSLEPGESYGAFAGYNIQRNKLVFGGELAYSAVNTPGFGPVGFATETFDYFLDGKARIGYAMNKVLVYGFAGYSGGSFTFAGGPSHDVSGMNYGVGIDVMLGSRFFVGAEYIVRDLEGASSATQTQTTNIQAMQIRAGLKF